jgi:hypothetical protein
MKYLYVYGEQGSCQSDSPPTDFDKISVEAGVLAVFRCYGAANSAYEELIVKGKVVTWETVGEANLCEEDGIGKYHCERKNS